MAATSPSPNSPPLTVPPAPNSTSTTPPPQASSPPPTPLTSTPSSQPNANPPETSNSTANSPPPPQSSPPPTAPLSPPPQPPVASPPPLAPPTAPPSNPQSSPPASPPPPPPPSAGAPPPSTSVSSPPPETSPPPPTPSSTPPVSSPPPPSSNPPANSPPPPSSNPPETSPPPPSAKPPQSSPPPPSPPSPQSPPSPPASSPPPSSSPPTPSPPKSVPPTSSPPPPPTSISPEIPPPPASIPPRTAPPPPRLPTPAPSGSNPSPPPENSLPGPSPPSPIIRLSPPPSSPLSPPPPSRVPSSPSDNGTSNDSGPNVPGSANTGNGGIGTGGVVAIGVVAGIIVLSLIGLAVWCLRKQRKKISGRGGHIMPSPLGSSPQSDSAFLKAHSSAPLIGSRPSSDFVDTPTEPGGLGHSRSWFTFEELAQATNGFSDENLLGEGGFGSVYKGYLPDGREIAVKQLKVGGGQGEREFKAEVEIISRVHHRHLVSLVGYCISENRRLLVYDYVPNNNLYFHLHGEGQPVLEWAIRVKIAAGAARGIAYLHEDCQPRIIHRDIKSSNILLDDNFEARVSDFGLAKLVFDADTHISTRVMGTFGYVAPEYASSGKLTEKSDVYSYGVVLLELITGRKPVDASQPLGEESLVEWARPLLSHVLESGEFHILVDPRLERNFIEGEMSRMIEIAATCVRHSSAKRPRMGQVVRAFDSLAAADITNGMRIGESELFNSAQQSEEIRWFRRMAFGSQDYSTDFFSQGSLNNSRETRVNIG